MYAVAILSVSPESSPAASSRVFFRRMLAAIATGHLRTAVRTCLDLTASVRRRLWSRTRVDVHTLEGITVYEAVAEELTYAYGILGYLAAWVRGGRHAFAAYCRDHGVPDVIHAHGRFLSAGALALDIKRAFGVPFVYTEHSSYFHRNLAPPEARPILQDVLNAASAYTAVSAAVADQVATYLQSPSPAAAIVPNVIDSIYESTAPAAAPVCGRFTFINVASLHPHKGVDVLLRAFKEAFGGDPNYQLQICGDGALRVELERLSEDLALADSVRFWGTQTKREILSRIDHAHALVLASHTETFGVVLIEALSRGRPVVATRCGGPASIVTDECGLLVRPGDVSELAAALRQMAASYSSYDGASIRRHALQRYGSVPFTGTMRELYGAVLRDVEGTQAG